MARLCTPFDDAYWRERDRAGGFPEDFFQSFAASGWLRGVHSGGLWGRRTRHHRSRVRRTAAGLAAAAIVWGAGMTKNGLMMLGLPLFVIAVIYLERLHFFRWEFVLRLAALGLAGFALYFVPPLVNTVSPHSPSSSGQIWLATFHTTKVVLLFPYRFCHGHRFLALATMIYFLLPTLPLLIRMRDETTYNKSAVDRFQIWLYRGLRMALLLTCFWLALDPAPGARQMAHHEIGVWMSMLTLDYLVALGAAFVLGNSC